MRSRFEGDVQVKFHLAPPLFTKKDPQSGHARKREYGGYMRHAFRILSRLRFLRGTAFDPFGYLADRKLERQLIKDYENLVEHVITGLQADSLDVAVDLLSIPEKIRGYGHVKERHVTAARQEEETLRSKFDGTLARANPRHRSLAF